MKLPPDLQRRLTESDQHLQAYLAVVPRRGADVVLHASARTAGDLADRLDEIAGELRSGLPRDCISSAGYWYQAVDLPWVDYAFMETVPAAATGLDDPDLEEVAQLVAGVAVYEMVGQAIAVARRIIAHLRGRGRLADAPWPNAFIFPTRSSEDVAHNRAILERIGVDFRKLRGAELDRFVDAVCGGAAEPAPPKVKRPGRMVPCDPYEDGEQCSWCNGSGERWEDDPLGTPTSDSAVVPIEGAKPEDRPA